jgi:hypothetical protein
MRKRRMVQGYMDMGRPRIPPLPSYTIMTDRVTSTRYVLTFTGTSPALTISLSTSLPTKPDKRTFTAFEGPYITDAKGAIWRLYITSGTLSTEASTASVATAPVYARRGYERQLLKVGVSTLGALTYTFTDIS